VLACRRFIIAVLFLALVAGNSLALPQPAAATVIKDLATCSNYARPAVERLAAQEIINGNEQGNFKPLANITRGEMITMMVRALKITAPNLPATATFKDVPAGHWASSYVEAAHARGIVSGISIDQFGVDLPCTREEMAAMFVRAFKVLDDTSSILPLPGADLSSYSDQAKISSWARETMGFALYSGLLFGTSKTTISPQILALREQAAVLVDRLLVRYPSLKADRQAAMLINLAHNQLANTSMLANHSLTKTEFALTASADIPQQFSVITQSNNRGIWPNKMYSLTQMEMPGLPADEYPPYSFEQYLENGIVYE